MGIFPVGYEFHPFNIEKKTFKKLPNELRRLIKLIKVYILLKMAILKL